MTISDPLRTEALAFVADLEDAITAAEQAAAASDNKVASLTTRLAEVEQSNTALTRQLADANETIALQQATIAQMEAASQQPTVEPEPEPEPVYSGTLSYTDPSPYLVERKINVATFSYSRKYKSTKWGTIVLPVALDYADWKARFEIAEIVGITINANGTFTAKRNVLGEGSTTVPNRPYLIRSKANTPNTAQTIKKQNCTAYPATPDAVKIVADGKTFRFVGSYLPIDFSVLPGHYYASGGNFVPATGSLNPMRVYLEITS